MCSTFLETRQPSWVLKTSIRPLYCPGCRPFNVFSTVQLRGSTAGQIWVDWKTRATTAVSICTLGLGSRWVFAMVLFLFIWGAAFWVSWVDCIILALSIFKGLHPVYFLEKCMNLSPWSDSKTRNWWVIVSEKYTQGTYTFHPALEQTFRSRFSTAWQSVAAWWLGWLSLGS